MPGRFIIVGGVAAGASAAARLRRMDERADIIILERGEHVSFANCGLPYHAGGVISRRESLLMHTPASLAARFRIDARVRHEAVKIIRGEKKIIIRDHSSGDTYEEHYDCLVLCPGASPVVPPIPGLDRAPVFTLRTVGDSTAIRNFIEENGPACGVVIGGGFIGLETAEMLRARGLEVTVIEASDQVMPPLDPEMAAFIQKHMSENGIELLLNESVVSVEGEGPETAVRCAGGRTVRAGMIVMGIGVRPETALARDAGLAIGGRGGIVVDEYLRTSDPSIFAAGDAVEVTDIVSGESMLLPMAGPANRQGWVVANNIAGRPVRYRGAQGTAVVKVFKMTAACTGRSEKSLKRSGAPYLVCHAHPFSHAAYYPGADQMCVKLIFDPDGGRLLGGQAVGHSGVDKRIDVIAAAIRAGMTVFDLQELELAYAPPYSSAKDPVNMAAYVAGNIVLGMLRTVSWDEIPGLAKRGAFLLDVRTPGECRGGMVTGAVNIPIDDLRARIGEVPRDREVIVYCQQGVRSYLACRILVQNGIDAMGVDGGYRLYAVLTDSGEPEG
jgi:NADPH-dependent 2,4-dienoyl-CoA reductase/sulfur reductase-like enzyme/rhodanese-related sulfurtransferase